MKKIFVILFLTGVILGLCSCQDYFLEKPDTTGTVDLESVFSNTKNAEAALFKSYRDVLLHGLPGGGISMDNVMLSNISGELSFGYDWQNAMPYLQTGLTATRSTDTYNRNWEVIRACYVVKENIDKVADMTDERKAYIKAEATALIAYRYMGMFYRYGGLPIVRKSFSSDDSDLNTPRATLQKTLDFIVELCNEAYAGLPDSWAGIDAGIYNGRLTKGVPLAIKARAMIYAARPLFNSSAPVIDIGENNNIVCFGSNAGAGYWQDAIAANEAVLTWANSNGKTLIFTSGEGNRNTRAQAIKDLLVVCSQFDNPEIILAYKSHDSGNRISQFYNNGPYQNREPWLIDNTGMYTNFLEKYVDTLGNRLTWPGIGAEGNRPATEWIANIARIEARFRTDLLVVGEGSAANANDANWQAENRGKWLTNMTQNPNDIGNPVNAGKGAGFSVKFYDGAGRRLWTEIPLFRLAETYLNLAEAYNEAGNPASALKNVNIIRNRAGLPSVTETDQALLREIIWREKTIEYFNENHRYFDLKHWKHPKIGTEEIGGPKRELRFLVKDYNTNKGGDNLISYWDAVAFQNVYWNPRMFLEPIPQDEVNKGIIVQNPGY